MPRRAAAAVLRKPAAAADKQKHKKDRHKSKRDRHKDPKRGRPSGRYALGTRKGTWKELETGFWEGVEECKAENYKLKCDLHQMTVNAYHWKRKWRSLAGPEAASDSEADQPPAGAKPHSDESD